MSACALRNKETTTPNELNEVVISDSKFALAKEKSKVIVKLRLRNCLRNQVNLLLFKYGCRS
jgi:hypothetical protein